MQFTGRSGLILTRYFVRKSQLGARCRPFRHFPGHSSYRPGFPDDELHSPQGHRRARHTFEEHVLCATPKHRRYIGSDAASKGLDEGAPHPSVAPAGSVRVVMAGPRHSWRGLCSHTSPSEGNIAVPVARSTCSPPRVHQSACVLQHLEVRFEELQGDVTAILQATKKPASAGKKPSSAGKRPASAGPGKDGAAVAGALRMKG